MTSTERLRDRPGFVRFWTAETVSAFGSGITALAIQVLVVEQLAAGATGVGLVNAARWLPYLLLGIIVGVLVDRARRRPVLVGTDLLRGLLLIMIPVLALTGLLDLVALVIIMIGFGTLSIINDAASQSILPRLVPPALITRANARLDSSGAVAQTTGPAVAGGLVSLLTAPIAILIDAATFLASAVLTWFVRVEEPPPARLSLRGVGREAMEGLRWAYGHRTLAPLALTTHGWFICNAVGGAVLPAYALTTLGLDPFGFGVLIALCGIGALLGSLVATRLGERFGVGPVVIGCRIVDAVAWATFALAAAGWAGLIVFGVGQLLFGLGLGASNANEMGYRQTVTPDRLQGRVNASLRSLNRAMVVIGAPLGGILGDALGFRPILWAVAVGFLIVAVAMLFTPARTARISHGDPADDPQ
ncbi:MFS transporter [Microlunatus speluncae]|uniref:MFS transporter n=1 Tax=Microlunatus speluncae TaxID=2594267 RepID=UPI001C2D6116|nr:MFS transporter [Microlunatus speluncae]